MAIEKEAPEEVGAVIRYNLSESAITDQSLANLNIFIPADLVLTGKLTPNDVLVTAGASTSLFIVATALLSPRDHLVITAPNYATNLETPRAIGCEISVVELQFESQFRLSLDDVANALRPGVTKLISVCSPNNPTGTVLPAAQIRELAALAKTHGCYLLVDETYINLTYLADAEKPVMAATLGDHVIGVSSMSKAYGVPGIRVGWLTTTNPGLQEYFLAAKEQISISGSVLDEYVAEEILARREELLGPTHTEMKRRRERVAAWIKAEADLVEWVEPEAGVMCFVKLKVVPPGGTGMFYERLLHEQGVYFGPGRWFGRADTFFRLGYGWPSSEELDKGLQGISAVLRAPN